MSTYTYYRCQNTKCGATDRDRGANLPAPKDLICSKCRSVMLPDSRAQEQHDAQSIRERVTP